MERHPRKPASWAIACLEDICVIKDGMRVPVNQDDRMARIEGKSPSELYPYYGATGAVGWIDDYIFEGEHVLVGEDGAPFFDPIRTKAYVVTGRYWVNNHAHVLEALIDSRFLSHFLNQFDYHGFVTGTTRLKLNQAAMRSIPVLVPPLVEQRAIAAKIDALFSELDKGIEQLQTIKQQLKQYRQTVLKAAFEGKLTAAWRAEQQATGNLPTDGELLERIRRERGLRDLPRFRPAQDSIPQEWVWVHLGALGDLARGKSRHRPRNAPHLYGGPYPFIQTGDVKAANRIIRSFTQTYSEEGLEQSRMWPAGTLCITIAANIAETAFLGFDGCFPDSIVGFTACEPLIHPEYVHFFFESAKYRIAAHAPSTAQKNINLSTLENLVIPYCSREEQTLLVEAMESRFSVLDELERAVSETTQQADALRMSILNKAFEGRLLSESELAAVRNDPEYEPADKLLERI